MNAVPELTLYFDGHCPFCSAEMARLRKWDRDDRLGFVDISSIDFDPAPLNLDMAALDRELHSRTADGKLLAGIDSMLAAYTLVGRGWLVFPLRIRFLRPLLAKFYRGFARNHYRFSRWLGYKPVVQCDRETCRPLNPFFRGR